MKVEQIYTGCLAQAAYYIESKGEAAVFDPLREAGPYMARAQKDGAHIKYIFETHFHADFVSGHIELARKTGAEIVYGPNAKPEFKALIATDGECFKVGDIVVKAIHTPGHTMESTTYLLIDEQGREHGIVTGDTLFIGDVGRPDLAQHVVAELSQDKLAGLLFDSLRNKIMPLADHLVVYPGHGAGSACGKKMSDETTDTLGHQKRTNYALDPGLSKEQFVKQVLSGLVPPPAYFPQNVLLNIHGYKAMDDVLKQGTRALGVTEFEAAANETGAMMLDTRQADVFAKGFVPGSVNIGIEGSFAVWVGTLVPDVKQKLLIIADAGREQEVITRLARVGYDNALGYLEGGFEAWQKAGKEIDTVSCVDADMLHKAMEQGKVNILDVRKKSEYDSEHVEHAVNAPLDFVNEALPLMAEGKTYYVHCAAGYRSMIFISILQARGYRNLVNVNGGFSALKANGHFRLTDYVRPVTLL